MRILIKQSVKPGPITGKWFKRLSSLTVQEVKGKGFEQKAELSIVLTGNAQVRKLNHIYRGKNKTTDVLSFPLLEGKKFPEGSSPFRTLGDVVINMPQTHRQALEKGQSFEEELALLLVHGILHLLGYDHATGAQEKRMFVLQDSILKKFWG